MADKGHDLMDLQDFCRKLPQEKLVELLMDMCWKDQRLKESELWRALEAERRYGVKLLQTPRVKYRSGADLER